MAFNNEQFVSFCVAMRVGDVIFIINTQDWLNAIIFVLVAQKTVIYIVVIPVLNCHHQWHWPAKVKLYVFF